MKSFILSVLLLLPLASFACPMPDYYASEEYTQELREQIRY